MLGRFKKTEAVGAPEFLVAGLGNPEKKYTLTRHNSGFLCVDFLAEKHGFKINKLKFKAFSRYGYKLAPLHCNEAADLYEFKRRGRKGCGRFL